MSLEFSASQWARPVRRRSMIDDFLIWLPIGLLPAAIVWRVDGLLTASMAAIAGLIGVILFAQWHARRFDRRWLIYRLDTDRMDVEDSADLLFDDDRALTPLEELQRRRIMRRIGATMPDLRPVWSKRRFVLAWVIGLFAASLIDGLPVRRTASSELAPSDERVTVVTNVPRLTGQRLRILPPAYTGLPKRDDVTLDTKAPQGSRIDWTVRFAPQPAGVELILVNGTRLPFTRSGDVWTTHHVLDQSILYRVLPSGAQEKPMPRLHRLDAMIDAPPQIKVVTPDRNLSLKSPGQRRWQLSFEADDDYGIAATGRLRLTIAEGVGENVKFRERIIDVHGTGTATLKRFSAQVDLSALGFVAGSDLIGQLAVSDNRAPGPQITHSPSLILRWPEDLGQNGGMEGIVTRVLPGYFRSERQIIIDSEALIKERPHLSAELFLARANAIGADQRILRLRYGQFLGEEQEGGTKPPPTADAETTAAHPYGSDGDKPSRSGFGFDDNVLEEYGHVHDEAEAATLLDPDTRKTLKAALDQMWQSELNLRQAQPSTALPFAYKALSLIKQVQQATRIFLARVGPELPPIDESRRLTGKREGIEGGGTPPAKAEAINPTGATIWQMLAEPPIAGRPSAAQFAALENWTWTNQARLTDPLALTVAIDATRRDPACGECRQTLRRLLWSTMARPHATFLRRPAGDAEGRRYLDALRASGR